MATARSAGSRRSAGVASSGRLDARRDRIADAPETDLDRPQRLDLTAMGALGCRAVTLRRPRRRIAGAMLHHPMAGLDPAATPIVVTHRSEP